MTDFSTRYLLCVFLLFATLGATAQSGETLDPEGDQARAEAAIKTLREGVLLVRLPSHQKKAAALQRLLDSPEVDESRKNAIRRELESTLAEASYRNRRLIQAFGRYYDFSPVLFLYDTGSTAVADGQRAGMFLDDSLRIDPALGFGEEPFFFARIGYTDETSSSGAADALILSDRNFGDLSDPFPNNFYISTTKLVISRFFSPSTADDKYYRQLVSKLDRQLKKFYGQVTGQYLPEKK